MKYNTAFKLDWSKSNMKADVVKTCTKHGDLTINDVFVNYVASDNYYRHTCKKCQNEYKQKRRATNLEVSKERRAQEKLNNLNIKVCKIHGELTEENIIYKIDSEGYKYKICLLCRRKWNQETSNRAKEKRDKEKEEYPDTFRTMEYNDRAYKKNLKKTLQNFGLSVDEYEELVKKQNNLCAICNQPEVRKEPKSNLKARLCIDHCHSTGTVRGLLCHNCNTGIGKFEDNVETIKSAIKYLKKYGGT